MKKAESELQMTLLSIYQIGALIASVVAILTILNQIRVGNKLVWLDYVLLAIFALLSWLSLAWLAYDTYVDWVEAKKWDVEE